MRFALCNEVVRELEFPAQCRLAAGLGYDGLEVAPFTLSNEPHRLPKARRVELRRAAEDAGVPVTGLHWLLLTPPGLSITSPDGAVRRRTVEVMRGLVELCADLGGKVLVHGSPAQRRIEPGDDPAAASARAVECVAAVAPDALAAGVTYCIEPLAPTETRLFTTVAEANRAVEAIGSPAVRTMIDHCAARHGEAGPVAALIERWLPTGRIAHVHLNDANRRGPGQGADNFAPVLAALRRRGYAGVCGVEPFIYEPDGPTTAARAIGYLRGILAAIADGA